MAAVDNSTFQSGYIAIIGRPNVGKSTLLNVLVGQKISITTHKPQTTRHQILGISTTDHYQMVFVDTPGFHLSNARAINRYMNRAALGGFSDVDVILFVVDSDRWKQEDRALLEKLTGINTPVICVVNKVDVVSDKKKLLPVLSALGEQYPFQTIVPLSAKSKKGIDILLKEILNLLPQGDAFFDADQVTDRSMRFIAAELIREKLFLTVHDELPYSSTVEIEAYTEEEGLTRIGAIIWVDKKNHKGIVIGKAGEGLKTIGKLARLEIEKLFDTKVFLQLWVKVKSDWSDDELALQSLGYRDKEL